MLIMTYTEAELKYKQQFHNGKSEIYMNIIFPFQDYKGENFVTIDFPLNLLKGRATNKSHLINAYANAFKNNEDVSPIWLSAGKAEAMKTYLRSCIVVLRKGFNVKYKGKFRIHDGNHRIVAAKLAGRSTIKASMLESHYDFYLKIKD